MRICIHTRKEIVLLFPSISTKGYNFFCSWITGPWSAVTYRNEINLRLPFDTIPLLHCLDNATVRVWQAIPRIMFITVLTRICVLLSRPSYLRLRLYYRYLEDKSAPLIVKGDISTSRMWKFSAIFSREIYVHGGITMCFCIWNIYRIYGLDFSWLRSCMSKHLSPSFRSTLSFFLHLFLSLSKIHYSPLLYT